MINKKYGFVGTHTKSQIQLKIIKIKAKSYTPNNS